jgi:predicted dehydrogenase
MTATTTNPLRCAIIGCGRNAPGKGGAHSIGYAHGWAIGRTPGLQLVAAADRVQQNAEDFAREFPGCTPSTDYPAMLTTARPDLVAVSAWPPVREEMVLAALAAGARAVVIEKPMAVSLGSARRMIAAAAERGARLFVNHQRRYGQPFTWWRDAVAEGRIGELESVEVSQPFGKVMDFGPHLVDAALFALGETRRPFRVIGALDLSTAGDYQGLKAEQHLLASVHFDDGVRLAIEVGNRACRRLPVLRANGTRGFAELRLDPLAGEASVFRLAGDAGVTSPATNEHFHHSEDGNLYFRRAYQDIEQALRTGAATRIDAAEALRGLEIILGAYESGRQRRMLEFPIAQDAFPLDLPPQPSGAVHQ